MKKIFLFKAPFIIAMLFTAFQECAAQAKPSGAKGFDYDVNHPKRKWKLPTPLLEISGITWLGNNHLLAIEDLTASLYTLNLDGKNIVEKTMAFKKNNGQKFDLEDITVKGNTAYALYSHGTVYKIANWNSGKPQIVKLKTFLTKDNNTEGICLDPLTNNLLLACKDQSGVNDDKKSTRSVYEMNPQTGSLNSSPYMLLEKKDIKKLVGEQADFHPSAIGVHPITHDIYVLSSRGSKCIAVYSHQGKLKSIQQINSSLMPQPEGLCFSPDGTLYITTEGKKGSSAYLFEIAYKN